MSEKKNISNDKVVSDIYEYIKCVDAKVENNDKTLKFIVSQQSEQMKELIQSKSDNLRRFFEEAIRMQTEIVRNTYEDIISELKNAYEKSLKDREIEYIKLYNQKELTIKSAYEDRITSLKETMDADCQRKLNECYSSLKNEFEIEKETILKEKQEEIQKVADKVYQDAKVEFENIIKETSDKVYFDVETKKNQEIESIKFGYEEKISELNLEYTDRVNEIKAWNEKNLHEKLEEQKNYYESEMAKRTKEAYDNGKAETEAWHDDIVRQKLEVQAAYFEGEIERAKQETKAEMYAEMDAAARRNEEELKLFLDFYEAKIKPFKKLINIHETTDTRIKDIQRRVRNKIDKTFGNTDKKEDAQIKDGGEE